MVAYSFQQRFVAPTVAKTKQSTLRAPSLKRLPEIGCTIRLYTGMRTKNCCLIGTATTLRVSRVWIDFQEETIFSPGDMEQISGIDADNFAFLYGFAHFTDLKNWFQDSIPGILRWGGNRIFFGDTFVPAKLAA